ncbi:MAG: hypothetical protein CL849_03240 [Crocinitomicaceae bacterium]|nr:hypothetical protein [Crocinitomicaceae bacterium]
MRICSLFHAASLQRSPFFQSATTNASTERIRLGALNCFLSIVLLMGAQISQAQISQGGSPWKWGSNIDMSTIPTFTSEALDLNVLAAEDAVTDQYKEAPWRFGVEREVSLGLDNAGEWTFEKDRWIWRLAIHCEGATGIGLTLGDFDLPSGAQLFVWNQARTQFLGSFTEANEKDWGFLPLGLLNDDHIVVEYQEPESVHGLGEVRISQIVHGYRSLLLHPQNPEANTANMGPFGNSGACNINVNCPEGAAWQTQKKSVALITNGGFAVCTGALVNNTLEDGTPYFLTANHCLGNPNSWVYYFNHESSTCDGNTGPTNQSISGGTLLVNSGNSDVALIELSSAPPADFNVEYAGWDASGSAPTSAVGIHHPSGDVKKICFENDAPYTSTAGGAQVWWINAWEAGVTEPGSSGSPLFDGNQRIIGQLYGGAAACSGSVNNGAYDYYGRFDVSWGVGVSGYLDPLGTGQLTLDSYPTNSNPDAGCTDPTACNYDPEATEDNGTCVQDDVCGICGGDGSSCSGCTNEEACNYDATATIDDGSCILPQNDLPCDCDAEGALDVTLGAEEESASYTFEAEGSPESLDLNLNWSNTDNGGSWPADLAISITGPDGGCIALGGYNSSPAGCTSVGDFNLWPADWQTTTSGTYTAFLDLTGTGLSGNGSWSVSLYNGYSTSANVQYDASWTIAGLCGSGGGGIAGCTDSTACNFEPSAIEDDGSCLALDLCGVCGGDDSTCSGCTDSEACNFNPEAILDDGSCVLDGFNFSLTLLLDNFPGETTWNLLDSTGAAVASGGPYAEAGATIEESFCVGDGCYTFQLFDSFGDGICCAYGVGDYVLSVDGVEYVNGGEFADLESTSVCVGGNYGCTDETACNYDAEAELDNGNCDYSCYGCTDPESCNYDADATLDDGSCVGDGLAVALTINLDNYPGETTWNLVDSLGAQVASGGPYSEAGGTVIENFCIGDGCYTFNIYDSFGDGICCGWGSGSYDLTIDGVSMASGGDFGDGESISFCAGGAYGCTDNTACNYDADAEFDNNACDFSCYGCTDSASCNYDEDATIDDGSCVGEGINIAVSITTDTWPGETTWSLSDSTGNILLNGGPYTSIGETFEENICVGDGCYTFDILDSWGDGIYEPGGYTLTVDSTVIASGGDFGDGESVSFCTDNINFGCTDPQACNYDEDAGIDNGNCDYSCVGCTIETACNYDPSATTDDGSCLFNDDCGVCGGDNSSCSGCTDTEACNYDEEAVFEDGSCLQNDECGVCGGDNSTCGGCTDPAACNYDADAVIDDGSCVSEGVNFTMTTVLDNYPGEFSWVLADENGSEVWSGGPYDGQEGTVVESTCLPAGCYDLTVTDTFGDGICCDWGDGSYTLEIDGAVVASGGDFGATETVNTCTGGDIPGCTDAEACNYSPSATVDNGSCTYPVSDNVDCDGNCLNDSDNDGICDEDEQAESSFVQIGYDVVAQNTVEGMTTYRIWAEFADPTEQLVAVYGFDSVPMTINTTTTFYQNTLGGPLAVGYNPALLPVDPLLEFDSWLTVGGEDNSADVSSIGLDFAAFEGSGGSIVADDVNGGSVFIYPDLEPTAFPDANGQVLIAQLTTDGEVSFTVNLQTRTNNGENPQILQQSLTFQEVYECFGDFNNDGIIGIGDLLMLLGDFGCPANCNHDMNGDGSVTTSDMLVMLSVFGGECD